jgi:integrase/recombinase XerD
MSSTDLIDQFLDAVWVEQGLSKNTLSAYSSDLRIFAKWLSDKSMLDVDKGDLSRFLTTRYEAGIGNRSTARILSSLRRFYGYYIRENSLIIDPTLLIESPHIGRHLPVSLSELDVELLLNAPEVTNTNGF